MRFNPLTPVAVYNGQPRAGWPMHQQITPILLAHAKTLGYSGSKLPVAGLPRLAVQGVEVWVTPLPDLEPGRTRRRFALRVQSECPACKWRGAFGRFHQHVCK